MASKDPERSEVHDTGARYGVLLHVYYLELLPSLVRYVQNFPSSLTVLVSTRREYTVEVGNAFANAMPQARIVCRGVPNIGWDIAPMLLVFANELLGLDVVCKMHTKRSAHHEEKDAWREFLLFNLAGSRTVVKWTIEYFRRRENLGAVFPSGNLKLKHWMSWDQRTLGFAKQVCDSMGIDPLAVPDFPAGSMYWFRPAALQPLLSRRWSWQEFSVEDTTSQNGSLAHAVERIILSVMHQTGYSWRKVNFTGGPRRVDASYRQGGRTGIAAVIHIWSLNRLMDLVAGLKNLSFEFDVLVTVSSDIEQELERILRQHFPDSCVRILRVPNAGHDIGPFIALAELIRDYQLVCKMHIKERAPEWFRYLLDNLVGGIAEVNTVISMFERDPALGMVYPKTFPPVEKHMQWGSNFEIAEALATRLGLARLSRENIDFVSGSMFWCRPVCLEKLLDPMLELEFSETDNDKSDGTLSHAVERLFLLIARSAGFGTREVLFHRYRGQSDLEIYAA